MASLAPCLPLQRMLQMTVPNKGGTLDIDSCECDVWHNLEYTPRGERMGSPT